MAGMSLVVVEFLKPYLLALKIALFMSALTGGMTWAYIKGGEGWRRTHEAYIVAQKMEVAKAQARWEVERQQLIAQVSLARAMAKTAASAAEAADADADRRIDEAVRAAKSAPMDTDTVSRVNRIIVEANR